MKGILMVAYHYPPDRISSGVQRTLKFSRYLLEHDWLPTVLTVHPRAYQRTAPDQLAEIPTEVEVRRAFALDSSRHLSIKGRYPLWFALPDRWSTWWLGSLWSGLRMIRKHRPRLIWSTYPIATAHLIGWTLQKLTGLPWVADFRDSMTEDHYPRDPQVRRVYRWIERHAIARATRVIFTTPGTLSLYADRYPEFPASKWAVIPNGYDEDNFQRAAKDLPESAPNGPVQLVHSGILYPTERDPTQFFQALAELKSQGDLSPGDLRIKLRATAHDELFEPMIAEHGLNEIVTLEPPISYEAALREMLQSDGLLLLQAANCNHQIPAKLYEYMRARQPLLALTDPLGNTGQVMLEAGITTVVPLDQKDAIKVALMNFIELIRAGTAPLADDETIRQYSRRGSTRKLAEILNNVLENQ
jgi:glycosyltransferase involved in cell wall biosynthesis